jgi:hypothetical protein
MRGARVLHRARWSAGGVCCRAMIAILAMGVGLFALPFGVGYTRRV